MPQQRSAPDTRKPYAGSVRSLVIAIDVGTTFSGVSYAILEPTLIPKIHGVTRFPGQEHVAGNTKIPSILYYDKHGKVMAAGAEADQSAIEAQAEDEGWIKAELFKLRLRPRTMKLNMNGMRLGPLPKRKTAVHVFGDFLAYLYRCTRNFICDTHANGAALWSQVENDLQFVLSHPNGWEGAQQSKMRRAAIYGGLIPDTNEGKARIRFVTEGEASLHACVLNGLAADVLTNPSKHGFLIADAGGGTLDISAYGIKGTSPLVIEEITPPDCLFAGSVFVSRRAREFLEEKLKKSKYGTPDSLDHITRKFDETTKRLFRDRKDLQFIPFGSPLDKDPAVGIRSGQLKLTGQEVAELFEPSVDAAFRAIKSQVESSQGMIRSVFLVGGYAASPWLFQQLQERLAPYKVAVSRPDTQTSKAVADGAIGFYCDHHVSARMSKFMYGVEFLREMDPRDPDHAARKERLCELPSGPKLLPDAFDCILARSVRVKESTVFSRKYCTELTSLSMLSVFEVEIWCYRGGNVVPMWIDRQADDFSTLCVVRADLSPLASSAEPKAGKSGKTYWTIVFSVEIQFGLTEFKARIKWVDSGVTKYGPASIIYNERGHRADEDEPDVYPEDDYNTKTNRNTPISASSGTATPRSTSSRDRDRDVRSGPGSRARTPIASTTSHTQTDHHSKSRHSNRDSTHSQSTTSSRRPSISGSIAPSVAPSHSGSGYGYGYANGSNGVIPEVARVDRDRSIKGSDSSRESRSGRERKKDREHERERERDRERGMEILHPSYSTSTSKAPSRVPSQRSTTTTTTTTTTTNRIGETLNSIWGQSPGGGPPSTHTIQGSRNQSQLTSPIMEQSLPSSSLSSSNPITQTQAQVPSSLSRTSSLYSNTPHPQHQQSVPPTSLSRSSTTTSHSHSHSHSNKEPYVETISTTIENPKSLSPWDPVPPQTPTTATVPISRALSTDSRKSGKSDRDKGLWDSQQQQSIGGGGGGGDDDWVGGTSSRAQSIIGHSEETTVLLSNVQNPPIDLSPTPRSRAGSISASGWGGDSISQEGGGGGGPGWGTPRTVNINTTTAPPTEWEATSQISRTPTMKTGRSRKGSMTASVAPTIASVKEHDEFSGGGGGGDQWGTTGNNVMDDWGFDNNNTHEQNQPPPSTDLSHSLLPIETTRSLGEGTKTLKTTGSKTPKTPATEISNETPVDESVVGSSKKKKRKGSAASTATAAAVAQEEEVRKRKEAEEVERARLAAEEAERARIASEEAEKAKIAAEEAEKARIAAEEAEKAKLAAEDAENARIAAEEAEKARIAAEEAERIRKEEEEEAVAAAAEAEAERKQKEEEQKAKELAKKQKQEEKKAAESVKGSKKKKTKKGATANALDDAAEKEKERLEAEQQAQAEQERLAKEAHEAEEAKHREEQERLAKEAQEAEEAKHREEQERLAKEAQEKEAEDAKQREEQERLAKEEKEKEEKEAQEAKEREEKQKKEQEAADAVAAEEFSAPVKGKKGKKSRRGSTMETVLGNDGAEEERKKQEEEERLAQEAKAKEEQAKAEQEAREKAEQEAKEKAEQEEKEKAQQEAKEKAEQEAKEKEERERVEREAKEKEERDKAEREAKEKADREKAEREGSERAVREKAEQEAREREERARAEKEKRTSQIGGGSNSSLFDSWGSGNGGSQNSGSNTGGGGGWGLPWGKPKSTASAVSSLKSGFGKLLGDYDNKPEESPWTNTPTKQRNSIFDNLKFDTPVTPSKPANNSNSLFDGIALSSLPPPPSAIDAPLPVPNKAPSQAPSRAVSKPPSRTNSPALPTPAPLTPATEPLINASAEPVEDAVSQAPAPVEDTVPQASELVEEVTTTNAEDEWALPIKQKKKKGKNGAEDSVPSTPVVESPTAEEGKAGGGGKKKKGKKNKGG